MKEFFVIFFILVGAASLPPVYLALKGKGFYNKFAGILTVSTNVVLMILLLGFIEGRVDLYVDVAITYAILGFVSSVIIAKFLGKRSGERSDD